MRALLVAAALTLATAARAAGPDITATSPGRNTLAPAGTQVAVTFDQALLPASVTSATIRVFGRMTGPATGPLVLSNGNRTVMLTPSRPFSAGEVVLVNVSHGLLAADSTPVRGPGFAWQFSIEVAHSTGTFQQIDIMSNRIAGGQTRIYGALQADLDRDGWIDLTTVNEVSADLRVFMNRGDGSGLYHPILQPPYAIGPEASPNEPADFDGDGLIDVVASAADGGGVWIAHGDGDGTFSGSQSVLTGSEPHGVAVLDADGDGDTDIVDAVEGDDHLAVLLNDGTGTFGAPSFVDSGCSGEWALAAADMDGDYIYDLVTGCVNDSKAAVLLGNGNGTFTPLTPVNAGGPPWQVALGDVDADGDIDAAFGNSVAANGALLRGNGDGTLGPPMTVPVPGHTPASDLADLDGDGDLDWILSSFGAGLWRIYTNDGAGNFGSPVDIPAPDSPSCAVPVDFDNDGDLDLALSDELADVVVLMQNQDGPSPLCPATGSVCAGNISGPVRLIMKNASPNSRRLVWKFVRGYIPSPAFFGNPATTDDFALCIYDDQGGGPALVMSAVAEHGSHWTPVPGGWRYSYPSLSSSGTQLVLLKSDPGYAAKMAFRGKGAHLAMPPLGPLGTVRVELHRSGTVGCYGASFGPLNFDKHDDVTLRAHG